GRRDLVGHVNDGGDAAAYRGSRAGGEIFLVGETGVAEMNVGVDQARKDVEAGRVDHLLSFRQRVVRADGDDLAVVDGDAAVDGGVGGDNRAALHDQIRFHTVLLVRPSS